MPNDAQPGHLLTAGLIKLRDLPDNLWNADTLFLQVAGAGSFLETLEGDRGWVSGEGRLSTPAWGQR